jgi:uncharacterized cofD-like protein
MDSIVVIGGGTGQFTILRGLKNYRVELSAIVTMMDDGGSSGVLRDEFGTLPPGDVRRCLVALSDSSELMKELFQYRFRRGAGLKGHSFGNLFLTVLKDITGSDENAIKEAERILNIRGQVIPVTHDDVRLCAELQNGEIIKGERFIPLHNKKHKIKKVFLKPHAKISRDALKALTFADLIVLGPGDLFTSIIANLLVDGVVEVLRKSEAKKVFVCNLVTKAGETDGFKLSDFVTTMETYLGPHVMDYVVYNSKKPTSQIIKKYARQKSFFVQPDYVQARKTTSAKFVAADVISETEIVRHDSDKLAKLVVGLIQNS